jgi:hypothetical protein
MKNEYMRRIFKKTQSLDITVRYDEVMDENGKVILGMVMIQKDVLVREFGEIPEMMVME